MSSNATIYLAARRTRGIVVSTLASLALFSGIVAGSASAAPPVRPKPHPSAGDMSRGVSQVKGGNGIFGTVYTLNDGFNFVLLGARYTVEAQNDYAGSMPGPNEKLVILTFAAKNSNTYDEGFGGYEFTLVDENDQNYTNGSGVTRLASMGAKEFSLNLKPGQGVGQDPTANALTVAIVVPGNARIKKILLNQGRKTVSEEKVVRYELAGNTGGSPKNVITALPKYVADPTDPSGAVTLSPAPIIPGKAYPDGYYSVRFDGLTLSTTEPIKGNPPGDGKQYAIASFTAKNTYSKQIGTFDLGGQLENMVIKDTDGEKYNVIGDTGFRKAKRDEEASADLEVGEEFTYRVFFELPKDAKPKTLTFGKCKYGHAYIVDLTSAPAATANAAIGTGK